MKNILTSLVLIFIALIAQAQTGNLPYKTLRQVYGLNSCFYRLDSNSYNISTNAPYFNFNRPLFVNGAAIAKAENIANTPHGIVSAITVQAAINSLDSLKINNSYVVQSLPYDTVIPFNSLLSDIATHTLTHNDSLVIKTSDAIDNGGAQVLMVNNVLYKPKLGAFHVTDGCSGCTYDNSKTYTLLTFLRKRGLYIVAIKNFN
jgi:hypothetical protein